MKIRFTKVSNTHHRLEVIRDDGSSESADLETKSLLKHDLIHLAVEKEAALTNSVWGLIASGQSFADFQMEDLMSENAVNKEIQETEKIVGAFTGLVDRELNVQDWFSGVKTFFESSGSDIPEYLTVEFVKKVLERYRRLNGEWKSTKFGDTMEVKWK